jgi:hypothetical protein
METTNNKLPLHKVGRKSNAFFKARKQAKCKVGDKIWIAFYNDKFSKAELLSEEYPSAFRHGNLVKVAYLHKSGKWTTAEIRAHEYAKTPEELAQKMCRHYDRQKGKIIRNLLRWEKEQEGMEQDAFAKEANQGEEVQDGE